MTTVQPQNTLPANAAQLTYRFLAAVCLVVFLLWLAGLVFLEPDPYALYIFTGIVLAIVTLAAGSGARGPTPESSRFQRPPLLPASRP